MAKYSAELTSYRVLTPTVRELVLRPDRPFPFKAGQFLLMNIPCGEKGIVKRAYSLANAENSTDELSLLIKLFPGGIASEFVRQLEGNEILKISGPFGKLVFLQPPTDQVVFLCTGAGLSQHLSYLRSHGKTYPRTRYRLLLGVWNEDEIFYQEILEELKQSNLDFEYDIVVDTPTSSWQGLTGHLHHHMDAFEYTSTPTTFYLCGNPLMIKSVNDTLEAKDFPKDKVFAEAFH